MHNHSSHAFNITIQFKQVSTIQEHRNNKMVKHPCQLLAQAERSRSGELLSPRRELEQSEIVTYAFSRLSETSSPERDRLSLKTGARRLSDSSRNQHGRVAANLA